jgi:hypothetical protein
MTCGEKPKIEYPYKVNNCWFGGCAGCPSEYFYLSDPAWCSKTNTGTKFDDRELCTKCWDREIPGTEENKEEVKMKTERKFYTCTEISKMSEFEKNGLIARLQSDIASTNVECIDLKNRLRAKDVVIEDLRSTNDTLEERIEMFEKDNDFLNLETGRLNDEIKRLEKEKDDLDHILHSKIEALEGDIECRKKDLEYKNDQIDHLISRLDDQRKKIEDLENGDVLPYFIRKVVGDKLKEDPCCWATPAEKCTYIRDAICKSVPCSEAIKQLEKKVDDIPCIKAKNTKNELDDAIKDHIMKSPKPICWDDYWPINHLGEWNIADPSYDKTANHMMHKYKALRNAGFDHDTALSFIPMWSDD